MLEVDIERPLGALTLRARFAAAAGITALFGRSGTGKTSIVNSIAGLLRPARGRIVVDGEVLFDSERGIDVPRHRRRIGYVFQEDRLFPHLTVRQNLLFGRWFAPHGERQAHLPEIVDLLGIGHLLVRRPGALSGGEKQRVAIGRALLVSPRLLLLDEPLASLDAARKAEILPYLERLRDVVKVPMVYVSHEINEVARLADTLVLLSEGVVTATGPVAEVMARLDSRLAIGRFEAGSILQARVVGHADCDGLTILAHPSGELRLARIEMMPGTLVRVRVRARDVAIAVGPVEGLSIRNRLQARVVEIADEPGPIVDVRLDAAGEPLMARVTREAVRELGLAPGRDVLALVKSIAFERRNVTASHEPNL
jgi:molybdate transport system ATP-binding protein